MKSDGPIEVFTEAWAARFRTEINRSSSYREHGISWNAPLALEMSFRGGARPRTVVLDLHRGTCKGASCQARHDVDLIIRTDVAGWEKILAGRMDPIWGIMSGRLKLARGRLSELIPYGLAAKALVESAARIEARFPSPKGP